MTGNQRECARTTAEPRKRVVPYVKGVKPRKHIREVRLMKISFKVKTNSTRKIPPKRAKIYMKYKRKTQDYMKDLIEKAKMKKFENLPPIRKYRDQYSTSMRSP